MKASIVHTVLGCTTAPTMATAVRRRLPLRNCPNASFTTVVQAVTCVWQKHVWQQCTMIHAEQQQPKLIVLAFFKPSSGCHSLCFLCSQLLVQLELPQVPVAGRVWWLGTSDLEHTQKMVRYTKCFRVDVWDKRSFRVHVLKTVLSQKMKDKQQNGS